jgi:pimeloyl-ACP methyl ester carboxylesterase
VRDNTTPALVLHDPDDSQVPFEDAEMLVRAWPSARLETADGLGHTGILRDPSIVERAIAFLSSGRPAERRIERVPSNA